jgi:hypothetical protein
VHHALTGKLGVQRVIGHDRTSFTRNSKTLRDWSRALLNLAPKNPNNCDQLIIASGKNNDFNEVEPFVIKLNKETMTYEVEDGIDLEKWHKEISSEGGGRYSKGKGQTAEDLLRLVEVNEEVTKEQLEARAKARGITQRNFTAFLKELQQRGDLTITQEKRPSRRPQIMVLRAPVADGEQDNCGELELGDVG